jgi:glyoxylase-like metal-dependent hydrolase (beta-lactamase superfamily II)
MTRWVLLGGILLAGTVIIGGYVAAQRNQEFVVERLADNLVVIKDGNDGNTAVFIRTNGVVLVDTKSLRAGQRLLDVLRTVTDKPVTHILNTHHHYDHVGGNSFFGSHVEVIVHENAATRMTTMEEFSTPERKHGLPERTFKDKLTLFSGSDAIEVHHFGAAHTDNDAFVVFRGPGVMHAGDTFPGMNAVERHGGSAAVYPATMGRAAAEITGVRTVIPGHGPVTNWQAFVDNAAALSKGK